VTVPEGGVRSGVRHWQPEGFWCWQRFILLLVLDLLSLLAYDSPEFLFLEMRVDPPQG
jgi:hypothetical protein